MIISILIIYLVVKTYKRSLHKAGRAYYSSLGEYLAAIIASTNNKRA